MPRRPRTKQGDVMSDTVVQPAPTPDVEEIAGRVSRLNFQSLKFCAGKFYTRHRDVSFSIKGYVRVGEPITLRGRWVNHPKWGRQFEASEVVYSMPTEGEGVKRWLEWYAPHVGAVKAQKLIDEFGDSLMRLCSEDPGQVAACAGIPIESIHRVAEEWAKHQGRVAAASQLAGWDLTQFEVEGLLSAMGNGAVALIQEDPFAVLGRVEGFGWKRTDELAAKLGIVGDDPRRVRGAVAAAVRERYDEGSTAVMLETACEMADDKLGLLDRPRELTRAVVDAAVERKQLIRIRSTDGNPASDWLATPFAYQCEAASWRVLERASDVNPTASRKYSSDSDLATEAADVAKAYREIDGKTLDDSQLAAVANAFAHRISVVTGGAGAGKTLVARAIDKMFADGDVPVMLAAPTGKAARRLEEVIGRTACTLHRLLEYGGDGLFLRNRNNPLPAGVVIVDEVSMVDAELGYRLLDAIGPDTALVLIGDANQLPPVGPGALLRDILAHDLAPVTRLEKCHRQAGTLKRNCMALLDGKIEPWASDEPDPCPWILSTRADSPAKVMKLVEDLYAKHLPKWGFDPIRDAQIMTAKHDGHFGTRRLNLLLLRLLQKKLGNDLGPVGEDDHKLKQELHRGDKVIQVKNNYELNVMNGTIGVVESTGPLVVRYDDTEITYPKAKEIEVQLAYCLTPHRMQGSEVPCAVTIVPKAHAFMQNRSWLYTACTRAKVSSVVIGDEDGIRLAVERTDLTRRQTLLQVWAGEKGEKP